MRALWLENQKLTYQTDLPIPQPSPGEALIRTRLAGICSTDLELIRGYYPYSGVLGHEFVGDVVEAETAPHFVGKRVVGETNAVCGECVHCRGGRSSHCMKRTVLGISNRDGAFAEYFTLPVENLHPVPDNVPDEEAVFTEPLAAALEILEQVHIRPTDSVLVVGAGRLGQLISQVLSLTGANLSVVVRHEHQRALLEQRGITTIPEENLPEGIPLGGADVVIDATGSPGGFELAQRSIRPRGTLVLKSTYAGNLDFNASALVVAEVRVVGSRCGPFSPAIRLLKKGLVDPKILIDYVYPISDGIEAFRKAGERGVFKVLLSVE
ncbi:MAG: alcohol dehydrogenase [Anaerolineaceae bacterium 4572_5.1]|nr:MAG: alcohol dehydrogenase [Anaerolineaceae bacterium 4572_5.1]